MAPRQKQDELAIPVERSMTAVLSLLIADRESGLDDDAEKTEVLLSNAGLGVPEIARLMGKNDAAVRKTLQRARKR